MNLEKEVIRSVEILNDFENLTFKEALQRAEFILKVYKSIGQSISVHNDPLADVVTEVSFPIGATELYDCYTLQCQLENIEPMSKAQVRKAMESAGYVRNIIKMQGKTTRVYEEGNND